MLEQEIFERLTLRQDTRLMKVYFPKEDGPSARLLLNRFDGTESLSSDFTYTLELISDDARVELKDVMGKMVTVELKRASGGPRYFNGHVFDFSLLRTDGGLAYYGMTLRPWTAFLQRRQNNTIFHEKTTRQALEKIFGDYAEQKAEFRTAGGKTHTFRVQWDETDYNYLHRRMEEEGWFYWYEHSRNSHTLIIHDDSRLAPDIDDGPIVRFHNDSTVLEHDSITDWSPVRRVVSGKVSLSSFDFKQPKPMHASTETHNRQGQVKDHEIYKYSGAFGFVDLGQGNRLATRQMEEIELLGKEFLLGGNCRQLQPGRCFELSGHFEHNKKDAADRRFLILETLHHGDNNYLQEVGGEAVYHNRATVIRKLIPFRAGVGHNSQQPKIYGIQSAIVVGPPGEEIYSDKYGRVKVQFHWDREGKYDDKSSCWVRVASTWAGSNFGAMSVPRIGQEVLVQWLDGNPDLPIITGRVYNEANMPPWELPGNQTQTGILSRSSKGGGYENANAIRFEDKKGEEQLWLHAEKDQLTEVEHDEDKWVGNDRRKTIDRDETNHIKRDRTETVDHDETITVHNNRTERVDHDEKISIGDNRTEDVGIDERVDIGRNQNLSVGDNRSRTVGNNESVDIGSNQSVTVGSSKTETVAIAKALTIGAGYAVTVGGAMNTAVGLMQFEEVGLSKTVMVGNKFSITAGDELEITVGKANLVMRSDGTVLINGTKFDFSASGPVQINGKDVDIN